MAAEKEVFRLGELFCGAGGIACGALAASSADGSKTIEHAWANDFDPDACATYAKNVCGGDASTVTCGDVRDLDLSSLAPIDAFAYGFPCNSFSAVGERRGLDDDRFGRLYSYGVEVLKRFRPKWFFAENVSGIRSAGAGAHFRAILDDLAGAGYVLTTHLYEFEKYGVPQARHRMIVVGVRDDLAASGTMFRVPSPAPYADVDVTAGAALSGIPADAPNSEKKVLGEKARRRLSYVKPGQNVWQAEGLPEELRIRTRTKISQIYRKLDPCAPSYTVTAAGGGGTAMYHWSDEQRELTNRERARLQTFPDDFAFVGNYASVRKQIGMAVPPKGAEVVFRAILDTFAGVEYPSVEPNFS